MLAHQALDEDREPTRHERRDELPRADPNHPDRAEDRPEDRVRAALELRGEPPRKPSIDRHQNRGRDPGLDPAKGGKRTPTIAVRARVAELQLGAARLDRHDGQGSPDDPLVAFVGGGEICLRPYANKAAVTSIAIHEPLSPRIPITTNGIAIRAGWRGWRIRDGAEPPGGTHAPEPAPAPAPAPRRRPPRTEHKVGGRGRSLGIAPGAEGRRWLGLGRRRLRPHDRRLHHRRRARRDPLDFGFDVARALVAAVGRFLERVEHHLIEPHVDL